MSLTYHACDRTSQDLVSQPGDKTCNGSNTSCVRPIFQACSIQRTRKAQHALSRTCNHDARGQLSRKTEKNKQSSTLLFRGAYGIDTHVWFFVPCKQLQARTVQNQTLRLPACSPEHLVLMGNAPNNISVDSANPEHLRSRYDAFQLIDVLCRPVVDTHLASTSSPSTCTSLRPRQKKTLSPTET